MSSQKMNFDYLFMGSEASQPVRCLWVKMTRACNSSEKFPEFRKASVIYFSSNGPVTLDTGRGIYIFAIVLKLYSWAMIAPNHWYQKTLLLYDNTSLHKAKVTRSYLEKQSTHALTHKPYSLELFPCNFWLFLIFKRRLAGQTFLWIQDVSKVMILELRA